MNNQENVKLNGFECFWCKSVHLNKVGDDKYICKSCGSINYKLTDSDNIKFINAQTYMTRYDYEKADRIYQELTESTNIKTKVQALFGRLLAFFGVTYIKDFNGNLVITFSNYDPEYNSISESSYYKDIINSEYKDEYINKLNELDKEYKRIKLELDKGIKYDVFICTKISLKTKRNPNAIGLTHDSKYASSLYDALTKEGLKVFYSDKLLSGIDYDAQIYSALIRSKNILIISSDREYLESAWVQSEWERWINFINKDVKDKNSLYLFVPNDVHIELPLKLIKAQKFTNPLEIVNRLRTNKEEKEIKSLVDDLLNEAIYNIDMFDLEEAEKIYKQITHDYPNDYRGWLGLVDILIEKGITKEDKRYIKWLDKAIEYADEENKKVISQKYKKKTKELKLTDDDHFEVNKSKAKYNQEDIDKKKEEALRIVNTYGPCLYLLDDYQNDFDVVLAAVKNDPSSLKYASEELQNNLEIRFVAGLVSLDELNDTSTDENKFYLNNTFGRYPQTKVTNSLILEKLDNIKITNKLGYIEYNGNEYKKYSSNYYLVEPIKWKILESNNNTYKLVSDIILDQSVFYEDWINDRTINNKIIYPNNYEYSNIRAWLNGYDGSTYNVKNYKSKGFIDIAFTEEERKIINETLVDNSALTTSSEANKNVCNNTLDKIYLLSYQDVINKYFTTNEERQAKPTDYAKARGVYNWHEDNGYFWLRSPDDDCYSRSAYHVNGSGGITDYVVDDWKTGTRPVIEITIK